MTYETSTSFQIPELYYATLFEALEGSNVLIQTDAPRFIIMAASTWYLQQTSYTKEALIGKGIFEAFPNGTDRNDTGVSDVRASMIHR
jgi:hypothetical protein